ncbi:Gfo/Idh/MocA family protein [Kineosporia sp. A_224]|uniref:Gfo/Idh/MocA family protein n=1 Tax=Kineosporia sp. A_224 TaxID=1962180 RepID=UPI001E415B9D|nr:Gfo/Idh/MocA family oxidoreductase [Kineosporia sp. A_224]
MDTPVEPLRIGVLGAARISSLSIVSPAKATGHRLVAVAARDRSRAQAWAADHGVERVVDSYEDLLADPEVDVVYNPLPNGLHGPWNVRALRAGKHVLSEKPSASNASEAAEVAAEVAKAGTTFMEAFHYLFHPVTRRVLEVVASRELGAVQHIATMVAIPAPPDADPRWSLELAGGAVMDLGCYSLHAQRILGPLVGGAPEVVAARAGTRAGHPGVDEWLDADLAFPGGVTGSARCHMAHDDVEMTLRVVGTEGEVVAHNFVQPHLDDRVTVTTPAGSRTESLGPRSSYTYQLEAFAAAVRTGAPLPIDAADAVASMETIDAAYRAAGLPPRPSSVL